jgi:alanine dehydrogenase
MKRELLLLKRSEISELMRLADYIDVVEEAFRLFAEGKTLTPGLLHVNTPEGEFHIKAGGLSLDRTYFGLKANGGFFQNRARFGLPNIQGLILLFDAGNGTPLAVMDSVEITIQRTGAATAVAARYLAKKDTQQATICGCGTQGRIQLRSIRQVLPDLQKVFAFDQDVDLARQYAQEMSVELGVKVTAETDLAKAARASQCIVTCTPSRQAFLHVQDVMPGTFVAAIGADSPEKQEIDPALMAGNKVVVDVLEQCKHVGELHHALAAGTIRAEEVHAELGEVIAGMKPGRTSAQEIILYDATGTALQDAAAAAAVYQRAMDRGVGTRLSLFE